MPRPRSESFYLNLSPNVSAVLSIQTKASISAVRLSPSPSPTTPTPPPTLPPTVPTSPTRPFPFPRTPPITTLALPEDADDERDVPPNPASVLARKRSNPDLRFAQSSQIPPTPTRHPWSPNAPSPLRRDPSKPFCPSSLFTTQTALLPLYPTPRPIRSLPLGLSPGRCTLQADAPPSPELKPPPSRRRTPLHTTTLNKAFLAGPSGSTARRFGVRTAWNIDQDVRRSLSATDHLQSVFDFSSSDDDDDEQLLSPRRSSNIEDALEHAIGQVHLSTDLRAPAHHKRSPSENSDEDASSGSDGGEEYSPSHSDESSSDEEESIWSI